MLVKAGTLESLVKKMKLDKFSNLEKIEELETKLIIDLRILKRLEKYKDMNYISDNFANNLIDNYKKEQIKNSKELVKTIESLSSDNKAQQIIFIHALTIEQKVLQKLLDRGEISENVFWHIYNKRNVQKARVENGENVTSVLTPQDSVEMIKIHNRSVQERYELSRARLILTSKVIKRLDEISSSELGICDDALQVVIKQYKIWNESAKRNKEGILSEFPEEVLKIEKGIFSRFLKFLESSIISNMYEESLLDKRVFSRLKSNCGCRT